ncbi:MAG TPA: shikimate dehydrogenase [Dehalococcoidia bacterium]|nr:shikimate dehydrogenase [Dehalococcoidia bacterium]
MKLAALIGYPLAHSVTPAMHAAAFGALGIDARCEKWVTPPDELPATVAKLRAPEMLGANVTVPHKEAVIPLLDRLDESARLIGAVNCIARAGDGALSGHNTDKYGFLRSLRESGFDPAGRPVLVLGAGGAARAVVAGLIEAGAGSVRIANRTPERAHALARAFGRPVEAIEWQEESLAAACAAVDLIVNTTPMGTARTALAAESPLDERHFRPGVYAFDLVYNPAETPFLAAARSAGAVAVGGLDMLVYQGAESIRLWTGREPPVDLMREAAREALQAPGAAVIAGEG